MRCASTLVSFLLIAISSHVGLSQAANRVNNIQYFIDAACEKCTVTGHVNEKIWVATTKTYAGDAEQQAALIGKFKGLIEKKLHADTALTRHIVFRYQDSAGEIVKSYTAKEDKMKKRGYKILKVDFDPVQ